jgi:predicted RNA binding protein YcfA (HicA-like mRNA interferase family)
LRYRRVSRRWQISIIAVISSLDSIPPIAYIDITMNRRNRRTLVHLFETPARTDIRWAEVESLIQALGGTLGQGKGSRVRVALRDQRWVIHTPHPKPELKAYLVRQIRERLESMGITPEAE